MVEFVILSELDTYTMLHRGHTSYLPKLSRRIIFIGIASRPYTSYLPDTSYILSEKCLNRQKLSNTLKRKDILPLQKSEAYSCKKPIKLLQM